MDANNKKKQRAISCRDKNIAISGPILQEKAQQFAFEPGHENSRASNGWLHNFKKRNELIFQKVCGESAKVDDGVCTEITITIVITESTICNCFKKSGFTATTQEDNSDQPLTQEIDTAEGWETVKEALEPLEKDAELEDFVTFDDDVAVCGVLTDADIISSVTSVPDENVAAEDDDDDEPDCVMPDSNLKEACEAIGVFFLKRVV
ncbi:hypothetical protein J6590_064646 [Homalodisca vitripennis]|nr:hypothetical protein J6590_064646 [Homalodisca vitripennis]